jgi:uncharacterized membrane protein
MKTTLIAMRDHVWSSFWFVPLIMSSAAVGLAFATVALDASVSERWMRDWGWTYSGGAQGASAVLAAIAGSMITITGLVFSLTLVALSLTSSQFGPRLLRNFMRDKANQVVLGTFVATFLYSLLVLRTIRRVDEGDFVPHLSVSLGVLMATASMGVLIYFIHHIAVSIQADEIAKRVGDELSDGIERLFPDELGQTASQCEGAAASLALPLHFDQDGRPVVAHVDGYLQQVDVDALMALAAREDLVLRLLRRPGQYVVAGGALVLVWPRGRVNEKLSERLNALFYLGNQRTPTQDIEYAIDQLVEIAVRALSPGINDPYTAITCVDRLGSALCRLAARQMPSPYRFDERNTLRVIAPATVFGDLVDAAFNQIRQYGRDSVAVTLRLLETIETIGPFTQRGEDRAALRRHAEMIVRSAHEALPEAGDRHAVDARFQAALRLLGEDDRTAGM